ncbi:hypothetical protein [uncultured Sphingomonas sp.]|uniref:hypothetical protein n=1 Tax=uncultured Sphingomonas sp. TaxID=158754 RepID=UPI0035CA4F7E
MSRHVFPGHTGATSVALGWDRPLSTFFVQVFRPDPDEEGEETSFIWTGTARGELSSPAEAIEIARPWANLPDDLGRMLELDRLKTSATGDGLAQAATKRWIERTRD